VKNDGQEVLRNFAQTIPDFINGIGQKRWFRDIHVTSAYAPRATTKQDIAGLRISCHKPASGHLFDQNLLQHLKTFFAKTLSTERLPPFWGRNRFWARFWERGQE